MAKFLFVSSFDLRRNTSSNIRTVALMNSLHDSGHTVHCIFIPSDHVSDRIIFDNLLKIDKVFTYPHIEMKCVDKEPVVNAKDNGKFIERCRLWAIRLYMKFTVYDVYELSFMKLGAKDLIELDSSYDFLVSSAEPRSSHKFAKKIIRERHYKSKWILYWGDPMSNDVASTKLFSDKESLEERRLIAAADKSIYTNPCAVSYMQIKYPDLASKMSWIPTSDFKKEDNNSQKGDILKVGYFGDYRQAYRNLTPFYQACCENGINAVIIGSADHMFESKGTVLVHGRMSRNEVNEYEKDCGILIVLENISKTGNCIQVPGKLYHYGLTHKYVLVITESNNIAIEYERYNRFIFVPNDKDIIASTIKNIQRGEYSNINVSPVKEFMYDNIASQFLGEICDKI